jgi:peptidoglycan/LPS O-acetylase OafA/YrhL
LWHAPPIVFARLILEREPTSVEYAGLVLFSFVAAWLSWKFVERPFRRPGRIANPQLLRRYGIAILTGLGLAGTSLLVAELT